MKARNLFAITALILASAGLETARGQTPAAPTETPHFTAEQAARGKTAYAGTCAMCHGESLDDGEFAPPLKGPSFVAQWQGQSAADVYIYMNSKMPPTQPGGLGAQAYADIMAYVYQSNGVAPGSAELPADVDKLHSMIAAK